jgi:2-hydroxy-3-keto-5-methylthiopentenyl-1-phosphate phosphatase
MSKSKYIVLDIDATLVHTHDEESTKFEILDIYSDEDKIKYRKNLYALKIIDVSRVSGSGEVSVLTGIFRPHLREFLDYCRKYFAGIVIWSAGQKKYVEKLVENMFPFEDFQPILVYSYHDCITANNDDFIRKPLAKLYKENKLKGFKGKLNEKNTLILDDRDDTFELNSKNGVQIPEFESDMSIEDISGHDDIHLLKFMSWLETKEVKNSDDVRKLRKDKIFKRSLEDYNKQLKSEKKK